MNILISVNVGRVMVDFCKRLILITFYLRNCVNIEFLFLFLNNRLLSLMRYHFLINRLFNIFLLFNLFFWRSYLLLHLRVKGLINLYI